MSTADLEQVIADSFTQYAGAVIQSRSLVDVRDFVKPSARQIYYSMYTDNFTHDKPFKKTLKAIGSAMRFYIHGDASCEGIIMRSGQPFTMRYPIVEIEGSYGNLTASENWAAPRYTAARLSSIAENLLKDTTQHSIEEWVDNYDDTEKYPRVLASKGFYNIVNGSSGIAVGMAASIPQFNLKEVNSALSLLLEDPNIDFDSIYCPPDFATGGTIINADEVKDSIKKGKGKAAIIQAKIEQENDTTLVVTELPYGVYANTICKEIQKLFDSEQLDSSIEGFNDLTGEQACIKIYIKKNSDAQQVIDYLYQNTSLQKSYSINMTMLEDGRFPKVFGWKEALQQHLDHEKQVYINCYKYDLEQLQHRLKIVKGIILAIQNIDKVISIIRESESTKLANQSLQSLLIIDAEQAKAILDIKLARLAKLEVNKFEKEQKELEFNIKQIEEILASESLLKKEMINKFNEVAEKYGDKRRTQVIQKTIEKKTKNGTTKQSKPVEDVVITFNSLGYLQRIPVSLYRNNNHKAIKTTTEDLILPFTNFGRFFRVSPNDIKTCGIKDKGTAIGAIVKLQSGEKVINMFSTTIDEKRPYLTFILNSGIIKAIEKAEYLGNTRNLSGMIATKVSDGTVISVQETNGNDIVLFTKNDMAIRFNMEEVRPSGRNSLGVKGINLVEGDEVVDAVICHPDAVAVAGITIPKQKRGGKGKRVANR